MILHYLKNRFLLIVLIISSISFVLYIEPKLAQHYLEEEINNHYWSFYSITIFILSLFFIVYWSYKKVFKRLKFKDYIFNTVYIIIMSLFLRIITKDVLLTLNLMKSTDMVEKGFIIRKHPNNYIELQYSTGNSPANLTDSSLIRKIDSKRIAKGHPSLSQLNDKDFINVEFKKGILGYDFLD